MNIKSPVSILSAIILGLALMAGVSAQSARVFSGTIVTPQFELIPGVTVKVISSGITRTTVADGEGRFSMDAPTGDFDVSFSGRNLSHSSRSFSANEKTTGLQIKLSYIVPPITESVTIQDDTLTPDIDFRNDSIYSNTLFGRDDH